MIIDLNKPEHSYFYGFALTDGTLRAESRNRGSLSIEISIKDKDLLYKMKNFFNVNSSYKERIRETNFSNGKQCGYCKFAIYDFNFRKELIDYGFPISKKSIIAEPPKGMFNEIDFVRGLIDGDGSVGFTKTNIPFISFTTKSKKLRDYYVNFIYKHFGIQLNTKPNKRDNIYNIMVNSSTAQKLYKLLYYPNCICLERKRINDILQWKSKERPHEFIPRKWSKEEDDYILTHSIEESISKLKRSHHSITMRLWRLKKAE